MTVFASFGRDSLAPVRLLCLPHAGGTSAFFRSWPARLPAVDVLPVDLPGRGARFSEPLHDSLPAAVRAVGDGLEALLDRPYAVFGHCLGALLGFELVRDLRRKGLPEPTHLFLAAAPAPHLAATQSRISDLPDPALWDAVVALGGTAEALAANEELAQLLLPMVRADFRLAEEYRLLDEPALSCPVTAFAGEQDRPPTEAFQAWARYTTGAFRLVTYPGGHFFLDQELPLVIADVRRALDAGLCRSNPLPSETRP